MISPHLHIKNLSIGFQTDNGFRKTLQQVEFQLYKNEILGIVGESGSGKSLTSLAVLGLLPSSAKITEGKILYKGEDLSKLSTKQLRKIRGKEISMIFQEPMSSLNPSMKCGPQVTEILLEHTTLSKKEAIAETLQLFEKVKLPRPESIYDVYPHQISGGQKQRVMIAMAIACKPKILIADEPTTALDVTVQKEILLLLKSLQQETEMSIIFISHDLALVSEISDRVVVMYQGKIVEQNSAKQLFLQPKETYTKALLASKPSTTERLKKLPTVKNFLENTISNVVETKSEREKRHQEIYAQSPLLEVVNVEKEFVSNPGLFQPKTSVKAVNDVSFKIYEGETLGLVGESGCGKSTLGNVILQLDKATAGKVLYRGNDITKISKTELRKLRKEIQLIFQDPFSSLNPRIPVGKAIMEPMEVHRLFKNNKERKQKTLELLHRVGLDESHFNRYPHEFSGGQRQRIGIARTIAVEPKLIVCDESVSALDISVQAQVLNLLNELKDKFGFTYIFISHDLAVVKYMADQLLVMNQGKIVEQGDADKIYANPEKEYTQKLIDAIPKGI
ncbi:ABC transporter ATP-binding protein [Mesonia sp.]|uniref:ABC transporter ATP-binding protein n=1 Tax=Mesonia sp. TaxID=1960830 RepID=UPI00176AB095|nr:ABC transporter ATP-binding protein [Mesonia sp.]HIB36193.1 ABC transporter ATP-binding protein [Mesonia sp.]HIO26912.1 ABC transporter ATP-binding protein [Flavobacteriaceae bacterium]